MTTNFTVDDTDFSMITYSDGDWFTGGNSNEFNSTTHGTRTKGGRATFRFHGTFVQAFGTIYGAPDPIDTFTLDSSSAFTFAPTPPPANQNPTYHQLMYESPILQEGFHTLVVNLTVDKSWLWIDYFVYTDTVQSVDPGSLAGGTAQPTGTQSSSVVAVSASTSSSSTGSASSSTVTSSSSNNLKLPVGAFAGMIAGLVFLALAGLGLGLVFWRRRRRRRRLMGSGEDYRAHPATAPIITPYLLPRPSSSADSTTLAVASYMPRNVTDSLSPTTPFVYTIPPSKKYPLVRTRSPLSSSQGLHSHSWTASNATPRTSSSVSLGTYVNNDLPPSYT